MTLPAPRPSSSHAAAGLLKAGDLQRAILHSANFSSIATDANGVIQVFNVGAECMLGYGAAEVTNRITPADISDPGELITRARALSLEFATSIAPGFEALVFKASRGIEDIYELTYIRKDGTRFPAVVSVTALNDAKGAVIGYLLIGTDNTARQRAADELERLQSAALNAAADAIVIADRSGITVWVNPAFSRLTGYGTTEALGAPLRTLLGPATDPPDALDDCWTTINSGRTWRGRVENCRKDGSAYTNDVVVTPITDAAGVTTHFIAILQDVTERLQLEAQYRQAQRMESLGQLTSGIAHDFNNLLTVINVMSELVLEQTGSASSTYADVQEISRAGERAALLTRQLLAFSRQQMLEMRVVSLDRVAAGMEDLLRRLLGADIELAVVPTPGLGMVRADHGQLEQVITNLAVNARDAMPTGGQLTIGTQNVTLGPGDPARYGADVAPGPYVVLTVKDSGHGMTEETRASAFDPFFTTKPPGKGTGLGLATVDGIVRQSHGFTQIESAVGRGTTVRIFLPEAAESGTLDPPAAPILSTSGTETILLVDDDAALRSVARRLLERAGYTVLSAATGEAALQMLDEVETPVHLLLSDVVMPGMSGPQLAGRMALTHPATKIMYISGYIGDTVVRHGVLEAKVPFLNKPFTSESLLRKVRAALDARG